MKKFHVYVSGDSRPSIIWGENPFQVLEECGMFDESIFVDANSSLRKMKFSCTMADPYAVRSCDVRLVTVYEIG